MPNQRQPVELIQYKGRKHLTKDEISARRATEVDAPADKVFPPKFLNSKQKDEFERLANELIPLKLVSNLDTGELTRYVVAYSLFERYTKLMRQLPKKKAARIRREAKEKGEPVPDDMTDEELALELEQELSDLQHRYFDQCEKCAKALGLNITSRCRLIIPKPQEPPPPNKFGRFAEGNEQTG